MIDLRLQIAPVMIAQPSGEQHATNTPGSAEQRCSNERRDDCAAGQDDRACSNGSTRVCKSTHNAALSIANRLGRNICRARNSRVVFKGARIGKATTKLFIHNVLSSKQTEFGPVEARAQKLIDCRLKIACCCKDADSFTKGF